MGISASQSREMRSDSPATSMADALFSGTRQTLLGLLFGQPERRYTLSELIELAQAGSGAVQREVERLVDAGLVTREGKGRPKQYQANPGSPIFDELCSIARKILGPAEVIRAALAPLEDRMRAAVLYGSVARGTDRADSDIDVLIVSDELLLEDAYAALAEAERSLGRPVNPTLYTNDEFERRREGKSPFLADLLEGGHEILLGELD